jgi:hypothetical protein
MIIFQFGKASWVATHMNLIRHNEMTHCKLIICLILYSTWRQLFAQSVHQGPLPVAMDVYTTWSETFLLQVSIIWSSAVLITFWCSGNQSLVKGLAGCRECTNNVQFITFLHDLTLCFCHEKLGFQFCLSPVRCFSIQLSCSFGEFHDQGDNVRKWSY